jgi:hypothetical protein
MSDIFGSIKNPLSEINSNNYYGDYDTGLVGFISNLLKVVTIVAGIWTLINIILAGFQYVTASGNPEEIKKATPKIWNSIIGLLIIVASYILVSIFSWILFGDPTVILKPKIYGPGI